MISFAPSPLCHLIQQIWPLHLTWIPPPFLISLSQLPLFTQAVPWHPYVTWQAWPSKWWLYLNVDEKEMQTVAVFVNGVLFRRGGWGVWSYCWQMSNSGGKERHTHKTTWQLSQWQASRWALWKWPFTPSLCDTWQWSPISSLCTNSPEISLTFMSKIRWELGIC